MPRFLALGSAIVAACCVRNTAASGGNKWYLSQTYDASNFFDKFDFFASDYTTGDYNDVDPTSGFVNYLSYKDASAAGLATVKGSDVYLSADASRKLVQGRGEKGRDSIRVESQDVFNGGLFIARFSHIPKPKCGSWPAFWSYGTNWPTQGEVDMIEQWNLVTSNYPTFHTGISEQVGSCILADGLDGLASVVTPDCDNASPTQEANKGCSFVDPSAPVGRDDGGVYAMEWTDVAIKLYAWTWDKAPDNLGSDAIDTASWGSPSVVMPNALCDIGRHFADHKLVINMNFCGPLAGNQDVWDQECKAATGVDTCNNYVAQHPKEFADIFYQIQDIRVFGTDKPAEELTTSPLQAPTKTMKTTTKTSLSSTTEKTPTLSTVSPSQSSPRPTTTATATLTDSLTGTRPSHTKTPASTTGAHSSKSKSETANPTPSPDLIILLPDPTDGDSGITKTGTHGHSPTENPLWSLIRTRTGSEWPAPTFSYQTLRTAVGAPTHQPTGSSGDGDGDGGETGSRESAAASSLSLASPTAATEPAGANSSSDERPSSGGLRSEAVSLAVAALAVLAMLL